MVVDGSEGIGRSEDHGNEECTRDHGWYGRGKVVAVAVCVCFAVRRLGSASCSHLVLPKYILLWLKWTYKIKQDWTNLTENTQLFIYTLRIHRGDLLLQVNSNALTSPLMASPAVNCLQQKYGTSVKLSVNKIEIDKVGKFQLLQYRGSADVVAVFWYVNWYRWYHPHLSPSSPYKLTVGIFLVAEGSCSYTIDNGIKEEAKTARGRVRLLPK